MGFCSICGKELKKTAGSIGPVCMRKQSLNAPRQVYRISKEVHIKYLKKHDLFAEDEDGQGQDETTSAGTSEEEVCENNECQAQAEKGRTET